MTDTEANRFKHDWQHRCLSPLLCRRISVTRPRVHREMCERGERALSAHYDEECVCQKALPVYTLDFSRNQFTRKCSQDSYSLSNSSGSSSSCSTGSGKSTNLKEVMKEKIKQQREVIKKFRTEHKNTKIGDATVGMIYRGMRGLPAMLCETSFVDPNEGILFRGHKVQDLLCKLPKPESGNEPFPEGVFWLLCTGDIPTKEQVDYVRLEWVARSDVPQFVIDLLLGLPKQAHPMVQLSSAISAMSVCSQFAKNYNKMKREDMWECMYEDCMDLLAKIISIAAIIYTHTFRECGLKPIVEETNCWAKNFCISMEYEENDFIDFMRLYLSINSDLSSGSVSGHAVHLVGSALSDCYLAFAAGVNALAGPLDGLAIQEAWKFIAELQEKHSTPTDEQVKCFVEEKIKCGIIPGYGHAVFQITDPRFIVLKDYCDRTLPCDPGVQIVSQLYKIVPPLLQELGKVKNPCANINAHAGAILQAYKMTEMKFYPVVAAVSRSLGTMAWLIWARALLLPLERPNSFTTQQLMLMTKSKDNGEDACKPQQEKHKQAVDKSCLHAPVKKKEDKTKKKRICLAKEEKHVWGEDPCKKPKEEKTKKIICFPKEEKKEEKHVGGEDTCKKPKVEKTKKMTCFPKEEKKEEKHVGGEDTCKKPKEEKTKKMICFPKEEKKMWGADICKTKQKEDNICKATTVVKSKETEDMCKPNKEVCKPITTEKSKEIELACKSNKDLSINIKDKCSPPEEQKKMDHCKIDIKKLDEICKTKKGLCD